MRSLFLILAIQLVLIAAPAKALEPLRIYDRFTDRTIDPERWLENERLRVIKAGQMQLMQRTYGPGNADIGVIFSNWHSNLANPLAITSLKARIKVVAIESDACPSNVSTGEARARIIGAFFNAGVPTPGSQLNDVIAQVRLARASNSSDPAGVLQVRGNVSICTTADCNGASTLGNFVELGTATVGTPVTVQIQWDQAGKTFHFSREGGPAGTVAYSESDASPPSLPLKQLSTRVTVPSCQSAPRVSGMVDALFDNVFVNQSAAP